MDRTISIDRRFHGPPDSGNGGYSCGLLAEMAGFPVTEVTLRKPIPLDESLTVKETSEQLSLESAAGLIAVAVPGKITLTPPEVPDLETARRASASVGQQWANLAFPTCFVCGHDRKEGDGLRLCTGRVGETDTFATPWMPAVEFANEEGEVLPRFVWAALDCPGAFAAFDGETDMKIVLGRFTVERYLPVRSGAEHIITAWVNAREGRKYFCGTALYDPEGRLAAMGQAVWISLR